MHLHAHNSTLRAPAKMPERSPTRSSAVMHFHQMAASLALAALLPLCAGFALPGAVAPARRAAFAPTMEAQLEILGVPDAADGGACLLLPLPEFQGTPPPEFGGEMMLQELEDASEQNTQLFFNPDGTVDVGATDGPPPVRTCGLWQCGNENFQMTLCRTFTNSLDIAVPEDDPNAYSVTRVYFGTVDPSSGGVKMVEGRVEFWKENGDYDSASAGGLRSEYVSQWKGEVVNHGTSPIGWFTIDGNIEEAEGPIANGKAAA